MPIHEILLSNGLRKSDKLIKMSDENKRNTLIAELQKNPDCCPIGNGFLFISNQEMVHRVNSCKAYFQ